MVYLKAVLACLFRFDLISRPDKRALQHGDISCCVKQNNRRATGPVIRTRDEHW